MTTLLANFDGLNGDAHDELVEAAAALTAPDDFRPDWEGPWSRSFRGLDALRVLINTFTCHGVLRWIDGTAAGVTASFDSDGEQTDPEFINVMALLPNDSSRSRFGVFVTILVEDINEMLPSGESSAQACAARLAQVLGDAVTAASVAA